MNKNIFPKNYKVNQLSDLISQIHNVFIKSDNKLNRSRLVLNNITGGQLLKKYSNIKQQNQSKFLPILLVIFSQIFHVGEVHF